MNLTSEIIGVFESYRMTPPNLDVDKFESQGKQRFAEKVSSFVSKNSPIEFVMLGYPFKSINTKTKVIGDTPDKAEEESIKRINNFLSDIEAVYPNGARFNVASDGYAFNDLLGVSDLTVEQYKELCLSLNKSSSFNILDMKDFYSSVNSGREKVTSEFGITSEKLEEQILFDINTNWLYRGMIRFMEEELLMKDFPSRNQRHVAAKKLTKEMMMRNESWSRFVSKEFASNIRLSMHHTINDGAKFSFDLIKDAKHSPWHGVLVKDQDRTFTLHKAEAIEQGYILNKDHFIRP